MTAKITDIARGDGRYIAVGGTGSGSVFVSTDKITWVEMVFGYGECSTAIYAGNKFYVGVDGEGIYALTDDTWTLVTETDKAFTKAMNANGIPLFATTDGYIVNGDDGTTKLVKAGVVDIAYNGKVFAAVNTGDSIETFVGTSMLNLVSVGSSTLDGLRLYDFHADAKGVVIGVGKMDNDDQPVIITFRNGKWLYVISDISEPISHVIDSAVASGSRICTTLDYLDFTDYHDVGKPITALLYA